MCMVAAFVTIRKVRKKMSSGVRAFSGHAFSTTDNTKHEHYSKVSFSWCSYQKNLANETQEQRLITNPIVPAIVEKAQPVFEKFGDKQFLSSVEKCYTTNANEAFHHVLWSMCTKEEVLDCLDFVNKCFQ